MAGSRRKVSDEELFHPTNDFDAPPPKRHGERRAADDGSVDDSVLVTDTMSVVDDQPSVYINCQDDIWACWKSHLENDSQHTYNLERLGIIQCGYQLQCKDHYLPEQYNLLVDGSTARTNPVSNHAEIFDPIFDQAANKTLMARLLDTISYDDKQNPQVSMVASVIIYILLHSTFSNNCVCEHEGNYSHYVIWPLLDMIVKTVSQQDREHLVSSKQYCQQAGKPRFRNLVNKQRQHILSSTVLPRTCRP